MQVITVGRKFPFCEVILGTKTICYSCFLFAFVSFAVRKPGHWDVCVLRGFVFGSLNSWDKPGQPCGLVGRGCVVQCFQDSIHGDLGDWALKQIKFAIDHSYSWILFLSRHKCRLCSVSCGRTELVMFVAFPWDSWFLTLGWFFVCVVEHLVLFPCLIENN